MSSADADWQDLQSQEGRHSLALDGWRGIACLLVLFYHTGVSLVWPPLVVYGFTGVHLFFVLSGFLLFRPFVKSMVRGRPLPSLGNFYARRFARIYPPYLVALVIFTLLRIVSHQKPPDAGNILMHAALVFNYLDRADFFSINPVIWSLAIEMQFYLLLPLSVLLAHRVWRHAPYKAAWAVTVSFLVVGVVGRSTEFLLTVPHTVADVDLVRFRSVFSFLDLFGMGMLAACVHSVATQKPLPRTASVALWLTGGALFLAANNWACFAGHGDWMKTNNFAFTAWQPFVLCGGIGLWLYAAVKGGSRILSSPVLTRVGVVSYSIYLYHVGVQFFVFKTVHLNPQMAYSHRAILYGLISLFPALAVAALMYALVEKPSLQWVARLRAAPKPVQTAGRLP